jgi:hypothetical protein
MSVEEIKDQFTKDFLEKTAIIANQAFLMGREAEANRVVEILNTELQLHKKGSSGRGTIERIIDRLSSKGKTNGETN